MADVRPARPEDAERIVEIVRGGYPPELLEYCILGCAGFVNFVRNANRRHEFGDVKWYVLVDDAGKVRGCAEMRPLVDRLHSNHIFIDAGARGPCVGPALLNYAFRTASTARHAVIELDVFTDNTPVRKGYRGLGFTEVFEQTWLEVPTHRAPSRNGHPWHASGLPWADQIHEAFGFSEFTLHTPSGAHRIGRLGNRLFRAAGVSVLGDPCAMHALQAIDPGRNLLCIDRTEQVCPHVNEGATVKATSVRFRGNRDAVLARLAKFSRP